MGNKTYNTKWTPHLDAIQRMARRGFSYTEIGKVYGVEGHVMRTLLNRRGLYITRKDVAKPKWQPIETAPRGKLMLLSSGKSVHIGEGVPKSKVWFAYDLSPPHYNPTHWMDLPQPPKE
jgi:hypothetical protein